MNTHFDILIDASGSMGYFKDIDGKPNLKYLLPDGKTTRTELVKKILTKSILPKLSFADTIRISIFRKELRLNDENKLVGDDSKPIIKEIYNGSYSQEKTITSISLINNPNSGGTPIFGAVSCVLNKIKTQKSNLIIISDGDANDVEHFDVEVYKLIKEKNIDFKIYFIGISQDKNAERKSKNLTVLTKGKYVNLNIMNYDEKIFESMLFEMQTNIISNALKENIKTENTNTNKIESLNKIPGISDSIITTKLAEIGHPKENDLNNNDNQINNKNVLDEEFDLNKQVKVNTRSLKLISNQLDAIVKEISYIRKNHSIEQDEFINTEDDVSNTLVGIQSEEILFDYLKSKWAKTTWMNKDGEQGKPYDFEIESEGKHFYIECKGTKSDSKEFFLTKNEWKFYLQKRHYYRLYLVNKVNSPNPTFTKIEDLLKDMEEGKLIPCSSVNRKVKADRILFQIID